MDCSAAYAPGQSSCPNCQSREYIEEGVMPKITVHGGATNDAETVLVGEPGPELLDLPSGATVHPEPEEESSPGNSSETSSEKPQPSQKPNASKARSRARTTENPS
jgi:hypothetical protein